MSCLLKGFPLRIGEGVETVDWEVGFVVPDFPEKTLSDMFSPDALIELSRDCPCLFAHISTVEGRGRNLQPITLYTLHSHDHETEQQFYFVLNTRLRTMGKTTTSKLERLKIYNSIHRYMWHLVRCIKECTRFKGTAYRALHLKRDAALILYRLSSTVTFTAFYFHVHFF